MKEVIFGYRPAVGAIIYDNNCRFLMIELQDAKNGRVDYVKGGREKGESKEESLKRELSEEIGDKMIYEIRGQSDTHFIYDWTDEMQRRKGYIGQARTSFWVKYLEGEIIIDPKEVRSYLWVSEEEFFNKLRQFIMPNFVVDTLKREWEARKEFLLK